MRETLEDMRGSRPLHGCSWRKFGAEFLSAFRPAPPISTPSLSCLTSTQREKVIHASRCNSTAQEGTSGPSQKSEPRPTVSQQGGFSTRWSSAKASGRERESRGDEVRRAVRVSTLDWDLFREKALSWGFAA